MRLPRYERPTGAGRIRVYDQRPVRTADRYLVLFEDLPTVDARGDEIPKPRPYGPRFGLAMSEHPSHPQGVGLTGDWPPPLTYGRGADHRRIPFASLPADCQRAVLAILEDVQP